MRSEQESKFLNSLVTDCIIYRLSIQEALLYIRSRFGKDISTTTYTRRKSRLQSDKGTDAWLHNFTRIGFVKHHREIMDNIQLILNDSNRRLLIEQQRRPPDNMQDPIQLIAWQERHEDRIDRLKSDIRESANLLSELGIGTPIVAQIRAKLAEKADQQQLSNNKDNEKLV